MQTSPRHGRAAFSLIELMTVITIIVILAGLVVGGMGYATERQAKEKCRVQIALLSKGIETYKLDNGIYPATGNIPTGGSSVLFQALYNAGNPVSPTNPNRIYVPELDPVTSKQGWTTPGATTILDPWGKEYNYRSATDSAGKVNDKTQNPDFDLWSMGKDGQTYPATPTDPRNRDDIKNF